MRGSSAADAAVTRLGRLRVGCQEREEVGPEGVALVEEVRALQRRQHLRSCSREVTHQLPSVRRTTVKRRPRKGLSRPQKPGSRGTIADRK